MSKVRLYGDTSGFVDLKAPDVASNVTITLPNTAGPFATETYVDDEIAAIPAIAGIGSNAIVGVMASTFITSSTSFVDVTGWAVTITPSTATARVLVLVSAQTIVVANNNTSYGAEFTASSGASNIKIAEGYAASAGQVNYPGFTSMLLHSPGSASAVTYQIRIRRELGSGNLNVTAPARLIAIEVAA